ncbi:MAG TPA: NAAT family transporter [Candidatus Methanoperedenaceae archaeon]|nr:NAAT family transporter [Candidatus Methanoperedenaceae archaeon]
MPDLYFFIYAFSSLFSIVNPLSGVMIFRSLTSEMSGASKKYVARKSILIAFFIAVVFSVAGDLILRFFSITADSLRVAGGVLLFLLAVDMLFARRSGVKYTSEEIAEAEKREDVSVFPIAMPMLTGPGAITTVIVLMDGAGTVERKLMVFAAILLTFVISYIIFNYSDLMDRVLGVTGTLVATRIMGLFVGAIAVDFVFAGIWNIYVDKLRLLQ